MEWLDFLLQYYLFIIIFVIFPNYDFFASLFLERSLINVFQNISLNLARELP